MWAENILNEFKQLLLFLLKMVFEWRCTSQGIVGMCLQWELDH